MITIRITTPTPVWRGVVAGIGFGLFWAATQYMAEGHYDLGEALSASGSFGGLLWGLLSLVSERGQINGLLRRYGLIPGLEQRDERGE